MEDITPDRALLEKIGKNTEKRLESSEPRKKRVFSGCKLAFAASSLLLTAGIACGAAIFITSPEYKSAASGGDGADIVLSDFDGISRSVRSSDSESYVFFTEKYYSSIDLAMLYMLSERINDLTFNDFSAYESNVLMKDNTYIITFFCHLSDDDSEYLISNAENEDLMIQAFFHSGEINSKPFSVRISRNIDGEGEFDGEKGLDLITSADKLEDFLDGSYDEPFNNIKVN